MLLIPEDMEVPLNRRDTNKPENVRWLFRNLPVQNSKHPSFEEVFRVLKLELRRQSSEGLAR
jgi:hypothetical protein